MTKENNYLSANKEPWKFITKCENFATGLLQIVRGIAKCDGFILLQTAICVMKCDESIITNLRQYIPKLVPKLTTDTCPKLSFRLRELVSVSNSSRGKRLSNGDGLDRVKRS